MISEVSVTPSSRLMKGRRSCNWITGKCLIRLDRLEEAEQRLIFLTESFRAAGKKTERALALGVLAKVYIKQRKYKKAERLLLKAVEEAESTKFASCPYQALGEYYMTVGLNEKGVKIATQAADIDSHLPGMQHSAAEICLRNGYYDMALKYIRRALALQPEYEPYKQLLAKIQAAAKPGPPAVEFKQALTFFDDRKFRLARMHINRALAGQQSADFKVVKGYLFLLEKKYREAEALFRQALDSDLAPAGAAVGLGYLHLVRKDYTAARRLLEYPAREDSLNGQGCSGEASHRERLDHRMACLGMGRLLASQGKHRDALVYFDRAITVQNDDIFALLGRGNSLNAQGRLDQAQDAFNGILQIEPLNKYAMAGLGMVKFNKGKFGRAEDLFKAAKDWDSTARYSCPHEGLGMVYLLAGKLKQAKDHFRKAIEINPKVEYMKFNGLARIMIREGKLDRARELLRQSMKNYPYDNEARTLMMSLLTQK